MHFLPLQEPLVCHFLRYCVSNIFQTCKTMMMAFIKLYLFILILVTMTHFTVKVSLIIFGESWMLYFPRFKFQLTGHAIFLYCTWLWFDLRHVIALCGSFLHCWFVYICTSTFSVFAGRYLSDLWLGAICFVLLRYWYVPIVCWIIDQNIYLDWVHACEVTARFD